MADGKEAKLNRSKVIHSFETEMCFNCGTVKMQMRKKLTLRMKWSKMLRWKINKVHEAI